MLRYDFDTSEKERKLQTFFCPFFSKVLQTDLSSFQIPYLPHKKTHLRAAGAFLAYCQVFKGLAVTTNGAPRSRVGVGTLKVEPPGGTKESTGDQSKHLTEKYKH